MRTTIACAALLLTLTACGDDGGPDSAADPAGDGTTTPAAPTQPPASPGEVRSRSTATVLDTGDGAELCLGPIAESWPPQCSGPAITNWDWAEHRGTFERQGEVSWAAYAVTGTWDGSAFTLAEAIPAALYDPAPIDDEPLPAPSVDLGQRERDRLADELGRSLPGAQGAYADDAGHVLVDVLYDDGSLQAWADETYGAGVVVVTGALVDA